MINTICTIQITLHFLSICTIQITLHDQGWINEPCGRGVEVDHMRRGGRTNRVQASGR